MNRKSLTTIPFVALALSCVITGELRSQSTDTQLAYPKMVSLDQYLMPRDAEIAMARTAAPASISRDAEIFVLGRQGYESVVEGKNGFACMVERSWMAGLEDPDFWDPKLRAPVCFNPPAARFKVPLNLKRTKLALAGRSKGQLVDEMRTVFERNELAIVEPGAMVYMLSKEQFLAESVQHWLPHLMFLVPPTEAASWGAGAQGSPVVGAFIGAPERYSLFLVPVSKWSDGSDSPAHKH